MLESLITSKTRIKLLLKFFTNIETQSYLRELAEEFGESTNAVRVELNRLSEAGMLTAENDGRTKLYRANSTHSLFPEVQALVKKYLGLDRVRYTLSKLGNVEYACVTGDYAQGKDSGIIDLVVVGNIDRAYLDRLIRNAEELIQRRVRTIVMEHKEFERLKDTLNIEKALVLWDMKDTKHFAEEAKKAEAKKAAKTAAIAQKKQAKK